MTTIKNILSVSFCAAIIIMLTQCKSEVAETVPDVSDVEVTYEMIRYESLLSDLDTLNLEAGFNQLREKHPQFTDLYFNNVIPISSQGQYDDVFISELGGFLKDKRIRKLMDTIDILFPDFQEEYQAQYDQAFKLLKHYIPAFQEPNVYTLISEYAYQHFLFPDAKRDGLGVGLDMYLGQSFDYKRIDPTATSFSDYFTRTFSKEHILRKSMKAILEDIMPPPAGNTMLDLMIHNGKYLYILDKVLPEAHDSVIMEYSTTQMEWASNNELEMWAFFFKEKLFYETNMMTINKYVNPSPDSPGMPEEAPGRTGNYMGWQIVKTYMKKYPQTTITELVSIGDAQQIMDKSRYKPKKP